MDDDRPLFRGIRRTLAIYGSIATVIGLAVACRVLFPEVFGKPDGLLVLWEFLVRHRQTAIPAFVILPTYLAFLQSTH